MEYPDMISEKAFVSSFNSFWQELIPSGDAYLRAMNIRRLHFISPLESDTEPNRRAIVNEIGFLLYKSSINLLTTISEIYKTSELESVSRQSLQLAENYQGLGENELSFPTQSEQDEGLQIANRLKVYFCEYEKENKVLPAPLFRGCGFVDDCYGDLLAGNTIYEVKSGDRSFRLMDVKQILVYVALNFISKDFKIENVGFLNPRVGTYYRISLSEFSLALSGKNTIELLSEIIEFISSGGVSR